MFKQGITTVALLTILAAATGTARAGDKVSGDVFGTFASDYIASEGSTLGSGPVFQSGVDVNLGDHVTLSAWQDFDLTDKQVHEGDLKLSLHGTIVKDPFPGVKEISGHLDAAHWNYLSGKLGTYDNLIVGGVGLTTEAGNLGVDVYKLLTGNGATMLHLSYSHPFKPIDLGNGKELIFAPGVTMAYLNNFFHDGRDLAHVTPKLDVTFVDGKYFITLSAGAQNGKSGVRSDKVGASLTGGFTF